MTTDRLKRYVVYVSTAKTEDFKETIALFIYGGQRISEIIPAWSSSNDVSRITMTLTESEILLLKIKFGADDLSIYKIFEPNDLRKYRGYSGEYHE